MRTKVLYTTCALVISGAIIIWLKKEFFLNLPDFFSWFMAAVTVVVLFVSIIVKNGRRSKSVAPAKAVKPALKNRREFPRIQHQLGRRPLFQVDNRTLEVLDISERGIRFVNSAEIRLKDWVRGTLVFSDKSALDINGVVARKQGNTVSLQLIATIPAEMIARENRYHLAAPDEASDS